MLYITLNHLFIIPLFNVSSRYFCRVPIWIWDSTLWAFYAGSTCSTVKPVLWQIVNQSQITIEITFNSELLPILREHHKCEQLFEYFYFITSKLLFILNFIFWLYMATSKILKLNIKSYLFYKVCQTILK